jgi:hypothetical protein
MWCVIVVRLSRNQYLSNIAHCNTENIVCTVGIGNCDNYSDSRNLLECHWDFFLCRLLFSIRFWYCGWQLLSLHFVIRTSKDFSFT